MAKQSKGKKALKTEQKAVKQDKTTRAAGEKAAQKEPAVQKTQEVSAEKPTNGTTPGPVGPVSIADRAIAFVKINLSLYTVAIAALAAFMFYLRTIIYNDVFTGSYVNVSADDGVYHLRLLFNTLQHFPFRILYDPFTHYPYGSMIHFGPLFELIPATFLYIVGLGNPSPELVTAVAAYYPAVLGSLLVIPVYYMGKKLFGKGAGLLGAIVLAFMPGAILWRSMLGVYDHHIAEVLFMACTMACLVYALDAARESKLSLEQIKNRDYGAIKAPLIYGALTGLFMAAYLLNWPGAVLLSSTIFLYFAIQAVIDHLKGESLDYLLILSSLIFIIPAILILPYCLSNPTFQSVYYSLTQPVMLLASLAGIGVIYSTSAVMKKNKVEKWAFPAAILGMGAAGILILYILAPGLFGIVQYGLGMLSPSGSLLTIQEAWPTIIDRDTNAFTLETLNDNYLLTLWTALFGIIALVALVLRSDNQSTLAFLIWNIVMTVALVSQNRFTYYYGVNAALLTACLAAWLFGMTGMDKLKASFLKKVDGFENFKRFVNKNMGGCAMVAVLALAFIFIAIYPATPLSDPRELSLTEKEGLLIQTAKSAAPGMSYEWYDALTWMKGHTPDPQGSPIRSNFNYMGGQYWPPVDYGSANYSYPTSAYGVMSWWDYGHMIEYVAQRIPNANPFQAGVLEQNGTTGAAPYFASTDEARSVKMLDQLGSRYVVIDNKMAGGIFLTIQQWTNNTQGWDEDKVSDINYLYSDGNSLYVSGNTVPIIKDSGKWNNSIMNRLYYEDADGMGHYRLVYESAGPYYVNIKAVIDGQYTGITGNPIAIDDLKNATEVHDMYSQYAVATDSGATTYGFGARPPVKYVKVFEKVKGATLTGSAPEGSNVTATLTLKTDEGRPFNYTASTVAHNGVYSFTVPYPTEQMRGDGYSYGITPETKYLITYGNTTKSADVPESAVMNGTSIRVT